METLSFMVGHAEPTTDEKVSKRIYETLSLIGAPSTIVFCGRLAVGIAIGLIEYGIKKALFQVYPERYSQLLGHGTGIARPRPFLESPIQQ